MTAVMSQMTALEEKAKINIQPQITQLQSPIGFEPWPQWIQFYLKIFNCERKDFHATLQDAIKMKIDAW